MLSLGRTEHYIHIQNIESEYTILIEEWGYGQIAFKVRKNGEWIAAIDLTEEARRDIVESLSGLRVE